MPSIDNRPKLTAIEVNALDWAFAHMAQHLNRIPAAGPFVDKLRTKVFDQFSKHLAPDSASGEAEDPTTTRPI